ncbi:MAG: cation transporting ATPase C-terminal domain-containing protein [Hymenobacteraceae bacterium]|nr:cation transporting ATPase C-terminal domain-containing protein [Hymenobacteraceae bacterium]MDX5394674.1 cation transporting ATPase C-terminal domain-containing protein [Hymenobacteraceae bacterium]MDX5510706.1 cation transporting ATPase C-terminal domain-containing protein [Hymenobacteraceae bacterium]
MELGLATERGHGDIMKQKPVPRDASILHWDVVPYLLIVAFFMLGLALAVFNYYLPQGNDIARAGVFLIISMTQVFNTFNMRSLRLSVFTIGLFSNKWVNVCFVASLALQLLALKLPFMQNLFRFGNLYWMDILVLVALASSVLWAGELYKLIRYGRNRKPAGETVEPEK